MVSCVCKEFPSFCVPNVVYNPSTRLSYHKNGQKARDFCFYCSGFYRFPGCVSLTLTSIWYQVKEARLSRAFFVPREQAGRDAKRPDRAGEPRRPPPPATPGRGGPGARAPRGSAPPPPYSHARRGAPKQDEEPPHRAKARHREAAGGGVPRGRADRHQPQGEGRALAPEPEKRGGGESRADGRAQKKEQTIQNHILYNVRGAAACGQYPRTLYKMNS